MRLEWKEAGVPTRTIRSNRTQELWVFGDPESDGGTAYSCVGFVKRHTPTDKPPVWHAYIHEFQDNDYWYELEDISFASRSAAMREMRKRFNVAWIAATPEERAEIWDGYK
jgi:hypothetical protein